MEMGKCPARGHFGRPAAADCLREWLLAAVVRRGGLRTRSASFGPLQPEKRSYAGKDAGALFNFVFRVQRANFDSLLKIRGARFAGGQAA
jgi:hypothetical protein